MARLLAVALALLAGCDAEPYRVRFHLQLDAGRPVEDGAFVLTADGQRVPLESSCCKFFGGAPSRFSSSLIRRHVISSSSRRPA